MEAAIIFIMEEDYGDDMGAMLRTWRVKHLGTKAQCQGEMLAGIRGRSPLGEEKMSLLVMAEKWRQHLSKMEPTPALCALLRCTCKPVASRMPSCTDTERWENEAMSSSFQPARARDRCMCDASSSPLKHRALSL